MAAAFLGVIFGVKIANAKSLEVPIYTGLSQNPVKLFPCAVQGVNLQWVQVPPGNWSLQPVAIGAVEGGNEFC